MPGSTHLTTAAALGALLVLISPVACSRIRSPASDRAGATPATSASDARAAAPADSGPCFRLVSSSVEVGAAPEVVFDAPLRPPAGESYWIEVVPAAHPEHISRRWMTLAAGAARATLPTLPYAAAWEVRLHDGSPRLAKHVVCRRPLTVTAVPPQRIPVSPATLAHADARAATAFAAAVPAGSADAALPPRRWEVSGLAGVARLVLGRYRTPGGLRLALVVQGTGSGPGHRVELPGTAGAALLRVVDLKAEAEHATLHTYPRPGGGLPPAVAIPPDAGAPAVMLATESAGSGTSRRDLVVVTLAPGPPRLVLEFPLSSSGGTTGAFSTIFGPDLRKSRGPMLEVVVGQHAVPSNPTDRPGPPTTFVCRWKGSRYTCGRP
jgi:hypothetical protein